MRSIDNAPFDGRLVARRVVVRAGVFAPRLALEALDFALDRAAGFVVCFFAFPRGFRSVATVLSVVLC